MNPRILISGSKANRETYETAVRFAGGMPCSFYCPSVDTPCDGLLLAGGRDLDPKWFGQKDHGSRGIDIERDQIELDLVKRCLAERKPVFGICRGHQVINVALGGTLIQDLSPEIIPFHLSRPDSQYLCRHPVRTAETSLMAQLYGYIPMVNSDHHQVVDQLGEGLRATAWSESGLVEAMEHETQPIFSVQFHPERMMGQREVEGSILFSCFITLCRSLAETERRRTYEF